MGGMISTISATVSSALNPGVSLAQIGNVLYCAEYGENINSRAATMRNPNARFVQRLLSQSIPVLSSYHAEMVAGEIGRAHV